MATGNPFDILGDADNEDPSQLIAAVAIDKAKKAAAAPAPAQQAKPAAKLPSKPVPPAQAVREGKSEPARGRGRGGGGRGGFGQGRGGGRRYEQESGNEGNFGGTGGYSGGYGKPSDEGESGRNLERRAGGGPRGPYRGGRRGGFSNGEAGEGERPRRTFDRHSGTGRGNELKREGSGRGNWGTPTDDIAPEAEEAVAEVEKSVKQPGAEEVADASKENAVKEAEEEPVPEDKEMTLEEYEKLREQQRQALMGEMTEARKVEVDKELKAMQQLSNKKNNDDIFIKLGSGKDKRKEAAEKEDRAKKSFSINEFLKPAEGERYYSPAGRGRGRGRGPRGGGSFGGGSAPSIEDPGHFPTLGGK